MSVRMSNQSPEILACLQSINRFLEDIYGHPRRLSDVLRDAGMGEDEIMRLRSDHLDAYLGGLLRRWRSWMAEILPSRRDDIPSTHLRTPHRPPLRSEWTAAIVPG